MKIDYQPDMEKMFGDIAKDLSKRSAEEEADADGYCEREISYNLSSVDRVEMVFIVFKDDDDEHKKMEFIMGEKHAESLTSELGGIPAVIVSTVSSYMGQDSELLLPKNTKYREDVLYVDGEDVGTMTTVEHEDKRLDGIGIWSEYSELEDVQYIADEMAYAIDAETHSPYPGLSSSSISEVFEKWENKMEENTALCYWNSLYIQEEHRGKGYGGMLMRNALARHYDTGAIVFITASYSGELYDNQGERFDSHKLLTDTKERQEECSAKWDDKQNELLDIYQQFFKNVEGERLMLNADRSLVGFFPSHS